MTIRVTLIFLLATVALSACGRRGDLEEPGREEIVLPAPAPAAALPPTAAPNAAAAGELSTLDPGSPGAQVREAPPDAAAPRRRFFLDPLI